MKELKSFYKISTFRIYEKIPSFTSYNTLSKSSFSKSEHRLSSRHDFYWDNSEVFLSWKYKSERVLYKRYEIISIL